MDFPFPVKFSVCAEPGFLAGSKHTEDCLCCVVSKRNEDLVPRGKMNRGREGEISLSKLIYCIYALTRNRDCIGKTEILFVQEDSGSPAGLPRILRPKKSRSHWFS